MIPGTVEWYALGQLQSALPLLIVRHRLTVPVAHGPSVPSSGPERSAREYWPAVVLHPVPGPVGNTAASRYHLPDEAEKPRVGGFRGHGLGLEQAEIDRAQRAIQRGLKTYLGDNFLHTADCLLYLRRHALLE
jgi:hypothetical protein